MMLDGCEHDLASDSLLRTGEVAKLCEVSVACVRAFVREGQIEAKRLIGSNHLRFTRTQVERLMRRVGFPFPTEWKQNRVNSN